MQKRLLYAPPSVRPQVWPLVAALFLAAPNSCDPTTKAAGQSNEIVGEPFVSCAADAIYAKWKTRSTFRGGSVSVRHAPRDRPCYQTLITNNQIELLIPHLDCRLNRLRVLNPGGLLIEATVLISFHGEFLSAGDRLFTLKCLHTGTPKRPGNGTLVIGSLPTPSPYAAGHTVTTPECSYDIFVENDSDALGQLLRRVAPGERLTIGTPLFHEWSCRKVRESHCLVIANCMLKTPDAERQIIDESGCSTLPELLPQLNYTDSTTVKQRIAIFTIKEPSSLYFQCQLSLIDVPRIGNSTERQCPAPKCDKRFRRDTLSLLELLQNSDTQVVDLISNRIEVSAFHEPYSSRRVEPSILSGAELFHLERDDLCLSAPLATLISFVLVTISVVQRRYRDRPVEMYA